MYRVMLDCVLILLVHHRCRPQQLRLEVVGRLKSAVECTFIVVLRCELGNAGVMEHRIESRVTSTIRSELATGELRSWSAGSAPAAAAGANDGSKHGPPP